MLNTCGNYIEEKWRSVLVSQFASKFTHSELHGIAHEHANMVTVQASRELRESMKIPSFSAKILKGSDLP